jgi:phosphatidylserine/phosphatidylglycerophosphate/cardiolipin synthase-like enzyme
MPAELERASPGLVAAPARTITWLIDNAEAYRTLLAACRSARWSISITQLAFDADCVAYLPDDAEARAGEDREMRLADVLLDAVNHRDVDVRILLNASLLLDTAAALRRHFAAVGANTTRLRIRGIDRFPQLLHAKIVIVDERRAFLIGSPFANGYWDDSHHEPVDARRPARELGGRPLHDLSIQLDGAAVTQLSAAFAELWNRADDVVPGDDTRLAVPEPDEDDAVQIVCSAPAARTPRHPAGRRDILPALLAGIASAERLIYIEHQYLSSIAVIDALAAVLASRPALEVIVVLNQNPDVTAYRGWQNRRLAASGLFDHARVGLFALWTVAPGEGAGAGVINQVFVHSKVVIVDDRWAMVGSANLDGVSLETYGDDFSGRLGQRVFRGVRNFDVAAIITGGAGERGTGAVDSVLELRTALWREHLDAPDLDASARPKAGWLADWTNRARANAVGLNSPPVSSQRIVVLPYSRLSTPERQLDDVGVGFANTGLHLCFNPSWVEVHLSPNWLRNVFA